MTKQIQEIIDDIRSKKNVLNELLKSEKQKAANFEAENFRLNTLISKQEKEILQWNEKSAALKIELEVVNKDLEGSKKELQTASQSKTTEKLVDKNVQIDALVREIEYCIGQLK
jgi:chromosome segregation ATPase